MRYRNIILLSALGPRGIGHVIGFWILVAIIIAILVT